MYINATRQIPILIKDRIEVHKNNMYTGFWVINDAGSTFMFMHHYKIPYDYIWRVKACLRSLTTRDWESCLKSYCLFYIFSVYIGYFGMELITQTKLPRDGHHHIWQQSEDKMLAYRYSILPVAVRSRVLVNSVIMWSSLSSSQKFSWSYFWICTILWANISD